VASKLEVDAAYVSKMENNEKPVSKNHLKKLAVLFDFPERELHTLWLADKLYGITKNEPDALKAVTLIQKQLQKK